MRPITSGLNLGAPSWISLRNMQCACGRLSDPFGEHSLSYLPLADPSAKSSPTFTPAELHELFDYPGASSSKPVRER